MSSTNQLPNLASVLATLAAYAPPQPPVSSQPIPLQPNLQPTDEDLEEGEYDPSDFVPTASFPPPQPQPFHQPTSQPHLPPPSAPQSTPTPGPPAPSTTSASSTTTWAPALRHTTTLLSRNPSLLPRIKHLITTAHAHEKQWWAGRLALVSKLNGREEGRKKLDEALASVGGLTASSSSAGSTVASELAPSEELALYDRKVHRACRDMVTATHGELARMGVPFLGVVGDAKITQGELRELQKRMVRFLEEFVGE